MRANCCAGGLTECNSDQGYRVLGVIQGLLVKKGETGDQDSGIQRYSG